ncbi:MAG: cell division protein ZapA [Pseudomonadota bacterium]
MGQINVMLSGRTFRLACADHDEARLKHVSSIVKARFEALEREFGNAGDDRLLLMAALMVADQCMDAEQMLDATEEQLEAVRAELAARAEAAAANETIAQEAQAPALLAAL